MTVKYVSISSKVLVAVLMLTMGSNESWMGASHHRTKHNGHMEHWPVLPANGMFVLLCVGSRVQDLILGQRLICLYQFPTIMRELV